MREGAQGAHGAKLHKSIIHMYTHRLCVNNTTGADWHDILIFISYY